MPPIEEVLQKAPIVIDAKVVGKDRLNNLELEVQQCFRGLDPKNTKLTLTSIALSCEPSAPGYHGMKVGERYIFVLHSVNTLYEESTFYPVACEGEALEGWQVVDPRATHVAWTLTCMR